MQKCDVTLRMGNYCGRIFPSVNILLSALILRASDFNFHDIPVIVVDTNWGSLGRIVQELSVSVSPYISGKDGLKSKYIGTLYVTFLMQLK